MNSEAAPCCADVCVTLLGGGVRSASLRCLTLPLLLIRGGKAARGHCAVAQLLAKQRDNGPHRTCRPPSRRNSLFPGNVNKRLVLEGGCLKFLHCVPRSFSYLACALRVCSGLVSARSGGFVRHSRGRRLLAGKPALQGAGTPQVSRMQKTGRGMISTRQVTE